MVTRSESPCHGHQVMVTMSRSPGHGLQIMVTRSWSPGQGLQVRVTRSWSPGHCLQVMVTSISRSSANHQFIYRETVALGRFQQHRVRHCFRKSVIVLVVVLYQMLCPRLTNLICLWSALLPPWLFVNISSQWNNCVSVL